MSHDKTPGPIPALEIAAKLDALADRLADPDDIQLLRQASATVHRLAQRPPAAGGRKAEPEWIARVRTFVESVPPKDNV